MGRGVTAATIASALAWACCSVTASAQSDPDRDRQFLIDLDMVTISKDLCGFALTDAQTEAVDARIDQLTQSLAIGEEDGQKLYDQLTEQMTRQKPAGLCNPKGDWAMRYKKIVESVAGADK
jgi:hypothetical protein